MVRRIQNDNLQTVRLVCKEMLKISTRLKHVDIQQHWLRQEYREKRFEVVWVPIYEMIADGFTKALPPQRHKEFVKALNLNELQLEELEGGTRDVFDDDDSEWAEAMDVDEYEALSDDDRMT